MSLEARTPVPCRPLSTSEFRDRSMTQRALDRADVITQVREILRLAKNQDGGATLTPAEVTQIELLLHV